MSSQLDEWAAIRAHDCYPCLAAAGQTNWEQPFVAVTLANEPRAIVLQRRVGSFAG